MCYGYMLGWAGGVDGTLMPDDKGTLATVTFEEGVDVPQMIKVASLVRDACKTLIAISPNPATSIKEGEQAATCAAYMAGWYFGVEGTLVTDDKGFLQTVTFEDSIKSSQMAKVFVLYLENHPEEENKPAHVALMHAMLNAGLVTLESPGKDNGK
jgi:hypothetical protein